MQQEEDDIRKLRQENLRLRAELEALRLSRRSKELFREWLARHVTNFFLGRKLREAVLRLYSELPGPVSKLTLADVTSHIIWRVTRIGIFAFMISVVPLLVMAVQTIILSSQNAKLDVQNRLILNQNHRLDQQIHLDEANRRSSFVFLMDNILEQVDKELKTNRSRTLSDELVGRIVSLTQALRPYRYLEGEELTSRQLSPERGQLLFALTNSLLDQSTYDKIFDRANFSYADLREANFSGAYLRNANLAHSYFSHAVFTGADLAGADLSGAFLETALFRETYMPGVWLRHANLRKSELADVIMHDANLEGCDMREVRLSGNFARCYLQDIQLRDAEIGDVVLDEASFQSPGWIKELKEANVKGFYLIEDNYRLVRQISETGAYSSDTVLVLQPRRQNPAPPETECEKKLVELLYSAPRIRMLDQEFKSKNVELLVLPDTSSSVPDSLYRFNLFARRGDSLAIQMRVDFVPATAQLLEIPRERGRRSKPLPFDQSLLRQLPNDCLGKW